MEISQALGKGRKKWDAITRRDKLITGFWLRNLEADKLILKVDKGIKKLYCWKKELVRQQICDRMMGLKVRNSWRRKGEVLWRLKENPKTERGD